MSNYLCRSSGGMDLPATSGSSDMIFKGCKFNDSEGNSITGTMTNRGDSTNGGGDAGLYLNSSYPTIGVSLTDAAYFTVNSDGVNRFCMQAVKGAYGIGASTNLGYIGLGADAFGNASASDVRSGVTFTSQNGLKLTGTMPNGSKLIGALSGVCSGNDKNYSYIASSEYFDGSKFLKSCSINIQAFLAYTLYDHAILKLNGTTIFGRASSPTSCTDSLNQNYNVSANQTLSLEVWGGYLDVLFAKVYLIS